MSCCEFTELPTRLTLAADQYSSGIVLNDDSGVLVCFGDETKTCEFFDGDSSSIFSAQTNSNHKVMGLTFNLKKLKL